MRNKIITQKLISQSYLIEWATIFGKRQVEYLAHVIDGLIIFSEGQIDEAWIQYGHIEDSPALHIYEPFVTLNYLGYGAPSVVSIVFDDKKTEYIDFLTGGNNGLSLGDPDVTKYSRAKMPNHSALAIDFWHFADNIASDYEELYDCSIQ